MNTQIFYAFYNLAHQSDFLDSLIIFTAEYLPYLVILIAGIFLLWHHDVIKSQNPFKAFAQKWREIVLVFFSGIFAWILAYTLKLIIHIPRPFVQFSDVQALLSETDFSFPSGHSTFFMALAFALYISHKKAGHIFIFLALLIGLARIAAGVHFPVDILGGFILGILTAYFVKFAYAKITSK